MATASTTRIGNANQVDWHAHDITLLLERALAEDLGGGDLTTDAVLPEAAPAHGTFLAKEPIVVAGLPLVARLFEVLDRGVRFQVVVEEGAQVDAGPLAEITGDARPLLRGERVALNFLQRLCGIATLTRRFVAQLDGTQTRIRDTRKTTPGLRQLEKYAVRVGGGTNHRLGLFDAVLIKENHAEMAGGVAEAVRRARRRYGHRFHIQAEVRDQTELRAALTAGPDSLLLDNMSPDEAVRAVQLVAGRLPVEASGGITLENVRGYAEAGADFISVGALTHSAPAADIGFELAPASEVAR